MINKSILNLRNISLKLLLLVLFISFQSCTLYEKPTVTDIKLPGDDELSCAELKNSFAEAGRFVQEAENYKGLTFERFKRTFFVPFLISGNYKNANEAIYAANLRRVHLLDLMRVKKCKNLDKLEFKNNYKIF